ncbi:MAG: GNAT family N-acetyltransferase [Flavobacteriaceae bacterium]
MTDETAFKILTVEYLDDIAELGQQLNPKLTLNETKAFLRQMFKFDNYTCFGAFLNNKLVGISSAWATVRLYSGKQLEVDNVIIDKRFQSKGIGKMFFEFIELWAKENEFETIELNTYVQNSKSHKFYFNLGFSILGFHFYKRI